MNHTAFFAGVKAGEIKSLYLFEGAEEYIKQQALARLCEKLLPAGMEQMNLSDLSDPEADALIAAAETLPFLGDKRVVVVRDSDLLTSGRKQENEKKAEAVLQYLQHVSPSTCLIFYVKGKADGRKKLYAQMKKAGCIVDFSPMNDAECASWTQRSMKAMGKQMDGETAGKLVFTVGRDAALLKQEMDKLVSYIAERDIVTGADIDAVCTKSLECTVFQMVDAQVAGRYDEALTLLSGMVRQGEERMGILAMLLRQYRILYHMRCLMEERVPQAGQGGLLGIPPFAVARTQAQARRYSKEKLKAAYDALLEIEYKIKTGQLSQEACAEAAMLRLDGILNGQDDLDRSLA